MKFKEIKVPGRLYKWRPFVWFKKQTNQAQERNMYSFSVCSMSPEGDLRNMECCFTSGEKNQVAGKWVGGRR